MSRFNSQRLPRAVVALLAAALASQVVAQDAPDDPVSAPSSRQGPALWEAGLFGVTSYAGAYPGSDQTIPTVLALPYALYRGPVFRVADGGVGVRAYKTPRVEWVVSATGACNGGSGQDRALLENCPAWLAERATILTAIAPI